MKVFLARVALFLVLLLSIPAVFAAGSPFSDISTSHPNYEAIMYLYNHKIVGGYPDGTFRPNTIVNRAEALKFVLLGSGIEVPTTYGQPKSPSGQPYTDVGINDWFAKFVVQASKMGAVQGYPDGTFKPGQNVNLVEDLKMLILVNQIDLQNYKVTSNPYADAFAQEWYAKYVQYAKEKNLIEADAANKIYPAQGLSRAKLAEIMYRYMYMKEHNLSSYKAGSTTNVVLPDLEVSIQNFAYHKDVMTIPVGTTVRWTNKDSVVHTVTSDNGTFASPDLKKGESFTFKFDKTGTYDYYCIPHPNMKGTIIVKPANEVPTI